MKKKLRPYAKRIFVLGIPLILAALACSLVSDLPDISGGDDATACEQPLDEETLDRLEFDLGALSGARELQPGGTHDFDIGFVECCYIFQTVPACVTWSVEPESAGSIDPQTGELTVSPDAKNGSTLTVIASVEDGRTTVTQDITIYTENENPLVGYWKETAQLSCDGAEQFTPLELIGELHFRADGTFSVTWAPFEVYRDYWGTYTYDLQAGTLELEVERGNHIPDNLDLSGWFRFDENGQLVLENMWLGEPVFEPLPRACGHIFN